MKQIAVTGAGRLSSSVRLEPSSPIVISALTKLSRASLISVVLDWLDESNFELSAPCLRGPDDDEEEDESDFYPPAESLEELRGAYSEMKLQKGSKRDVVNRIIEGDWRNGLTLYQLAMANLQYMRDHPTAHKWTAYRIYSLQPPKSQDETTQTAQIDPKSTEVPRFHPSTFVHNLQTQSLPDVKVHFAIDRLEGMPLLLVRILVLESPYITDVPGLREDNSSPELESSQTIYIAFPDASPHIYIAHSPSGKASGTSEANSLRKVLFQGIPKALSRNGQRYTLKPTNLTTRSLPELLEKRGPGRTNSAGGGWSVYADMKKTESPLNTVVQNPTAPPSDGSQEFRTKRQEDPKIRAERVAQARFGPSARIDDGKGVERVDIHLEDPPKSSNGADDNWNPNVRLVFQGNHVFAGIRQLVEAGIVNGERMPGWMTGEEGITLGAVRNGRIRGQGEAHFMTASSTCKSRQPFF